MALIKCPHCKKSVPAANRKCPNCGKLLRQQEIRFWKRFGISGIIYALLLFFGIYLSINYYWGWVIIVAAVLLVGLRLFRILAVHR